MSNGVQTDWPAGFFRVQRKLERWRAQCRPRERIPEELWREAAGLGAAYGIHRTAKALRLDYYSLKNRVAVAAESGVNGPEFVEVLGDGLPTARPECVIEVEDTGGVTMRIRLTGGEGPDVAALVRAFREGRS
jgi:hypothetical protein